MFICLNFFRGCILVIIYIINKLSVKKLNWKIFYEVLFNKLSDYEEFKIIGCLCVFVVIDNMINLIRVRKCILLGYFSG